MAASKPSSILKIGGSSYILIPNWIRNDTSFPLDPSLPITISISKKTLVIEQDRIKKARRRLRCQER